MPHRNWRMRADDILNAARKVVDHKHRLSFEEFSADEWTVDAALRNFTVIGEAARFIPEECYPHIPTYRGPR